MLDWIHEEIARNMRNILLANGLLLLAVCAILFADRRNLTQFLSGCKPIPTQTLEAAAAPADLPRTFVQIPAARLFDTGYQSTEETRDQATDKVERVTVKGTFYAVPVGNKLLLVRAKPTPAIKAAMSSADQPPATPVTLSGQIVPFTPPVLQTVLPGIAADAPQASARLAPFMLDTIDYRDGPLWTLALTLPFVLLALWNLQRALRIQSDPTQSPLWKQAQLFGQPEVLSPRLASEIPLGQKFGNLTLTPNWLVQQRPFRTWISPIDELAWAYLKIVRKSVYFIPVAKLHSVVLLTARKPSAQPVRMKKDRAIELLNELQRRAPWVTFGYDPLTAKTWRKTRDSVVEAVEARRRAFADPRAAAPPPPAPDTLLKPQTGRF